MRWVHLAAKGLAVVLVAALGVTAAGDAVTLSPQAYYGFSVGYLGTNAQMLAGTASAAGMDVLVYAGGEPFVLHGVQTGPADIQRMLLSSNRLLVVDDTRFYLRVVGPSLTYALRPADDGFELVLSPREQVDLIDTLSQVMTELEEVGVGGMDLDLSDYRTIVRNPLKGPAAPVDVAAKLDYALYALRVSEDWFVHAAEKGILLLGLKVEAVVEKTPGSIVPPAFAADVVSETAAAASLIVPIDRLITLALSSGIGYVRLPYVPAVPVVP